MKMNNAFKKRWMVISSGLFLSLIFAVCIYPQGQLGSVSNFKEIELTSKDRILILAPHPDDEVLGCGGIIQRAGKMNLPLKVVFLTYGDSNQWSFIVYRKRPVIMPKAVQQMGLVRHDEALKAAKELGVSKEQLTFLGYPDFRTLAIWYSHWGNRPPAKDMLIDATAVPYKNAYRPGAPYKADDILADLEAIIRDFKPTKIFLSHPADHNPDHQSLYLFTRVALWDLEKEMKPEIYPYLIHFKKWPNPYGYKPNDQLIPPSFFIQKIDWEIFPLNAREITINYNAIKKHRSQYDSNAKYLLSFIRANELYGDFPLIHLHFPNPSISITSNRDSYLREFPEELLNEELAKFVGVEEEFLSLEDGDLVFTLKLSRPLGETTNLSLYLFGYQKDKPFAEMPKIHIQFGTIEHKIFDQDREFPLGAINIERKPKEITVRIPLQILGQPDRILTSARTYTGTVPLDWVSWRVLELSN